MKKTNSIQILSESITNKIAAGEVIERPASIIKELLENSIDAQSTRITVSIINSGKSVLKILDNGIGMTHDDAVLSLERHATSKISSANDLNAIKTLGFRGEALPSIASIAMLKLISKTENDETGTEIFLEGGKIKDVKKVAAPTGTSVEVNQIFFNTPARKKFLKRDVTEMSYISQTFNTVSLAYPDIQFKLIHGEKEIINAPASCDLKLRISDLFGKDIVKDIIPVSMEINDMKLSGYISRPSFSLSSRRHQFFYVNNRCFKDKTVNHAVYHAYRTLLPKDRHPLLFLFFEISPSMVDVNVHPAKAEVRFVNQKSVHDFIYHSVLKTLLQYKEKHSQDNVEIPEASLDVKHDEGQSTFKYRTEQGSTNFFNKATSNAFKQDTTNFSNKPTSGSFNYDTQQEESAAVPEQERELEFDDMPPPTAQSNFAYSKCRPVGQIENSFIILEDSSKMVLVDQHTAHERILFEKLEREFQESKIERQELLFPVSIELSHSESILLENHLADIAKVGLEIECFGKNYFIIRAVPAILEGKDYSALLLEIIDIISKAEKTGSFEQIFMEAFKIIACHGAIRAHQKLKLEEIQNLLKNLDKTKLPYTCPHGRPISLVFSLKDVKKKFLRI